LSEELKERIDDLEEEYHKEKDEFINREMKVGETFLRYLYTIYYQNYMKNNSKSHTRRKIIVVKKKTGK
jgi:hypothetical protein